MYTAEKPELEELKHFGKKGMKWGKRSTGAPKAGLTGKKKKTNVDSTAKKVTKKKAVKKGKSFIDTLLDEMIDDAIARDKTSVGKYKKEKKLRALGFDKSADAMMYKRHGEAFDELLKLIDE